VGYLCRKVGQPAVVGEMAAGILLGPSLLGRYFPGISARLFPAASLDNLRFLSHIGLILFMFVVGMELDLRVARQSPAGGYHQPRLGILTPPIFAMMVVMALATTCMTGPALNLLSCRYPAA
jgi:Kef-type K+ transport system membrane component KefB